MCLQERQLENISIEWGEGKWSQLDWNEIFFHSIIYNWKQTVQWSTDKLNEKI